MKCVKSWQKFLKIYQQHAQHKDGNVTCIEWDHMSGK